MNIKNAQDSTPKVERIFLLGQNGTGKTSQILTLPGKTFCFLFDPGAVKAIEGADIDYTTYFHDILDLTPKGITKSGSVTPRSITKVEDPHAYNDYARDFIDLINDKTFESYDNICLDNTTMLSSCIMDQILFQARRFGQQPEIGDYATLSITLLKVVRTLVALDKNIILIGHDDYFQDDKTKRIANHPILVGALKTQLPLLFNNVLRCEMEEKAGKLRYFVEAVKYDKAKYIRTSIKNPSSRIDVTIDDFKNPTEYGLGKLLGLGK